MSDPKMFGELVEFTPIFDEMIKRYGLYTAIVYGRIWRRCQGDEPVCFESIASMAKGLKINRDTVRRSIKKLVDAGEIHKLERPGDSALITYYPDYKLEEWIPLYERIKVEEPRGIREGSDTEPRGIREGSDTGTPRNQGQVPRGISATKKELKRQVLKPVSKDQKRKLRKEAKQHFKAGPRREQRLDDYYSLLVTALNNNQPLPKKPKFEAKG